MEKNGKGKKRKVRNVPFLFLPLPISLYFFPSENGKTKTAKMKEGKEHAEASHPSQISTFSYFFPQT